MEHRDLFSGLVRLHILHHAAEHEIYGQWMIDELASHGYRLSPGTLYPMQTENSTQHFLRFECSIETARRLRSRLPCGRLLES
jgi:PadR family transcriptional regulator PadR